MDTAFTILNGVKNVKSTIDTLWWVHAIYKKIRKKLNVRKFSSRVQHNQKDSDKVKVEIEESWEEVGMEHR